MNALKDRVRGAMMYYMTDREHSEVFWVVLGIIFTPIHLVFVVVPRFRRTGRWSWSGD